MRDERRCDGPDRATPSELYGRSFIGGESECMERLRTGKVRWIVRTTAVHRASENPIANKPMRAKPEGGAKHGDFTLPWTNCAKLYARWT